MSVLPVQRSYADIVRNSQPNQGPPSLAKQGPLAPVGGGSALPPPIVNMGAIQLAKRSKEEAIFYAMKLCLRKYAKEKELSPNQNEDVASNFKKDNPELFEYILQKGPKVIKAVVAQINPRNKTDIEKVKEALYWIWAVAYPEVSLQPAIFCGILRKHIVEGISPQDIAFLLMDNQDLISQVAKIPLKTLQEEIKTFTADDFFGVKRLLPKTLRCFYLYSLSTAELRTTLYSYEESYGEHRRLWEISDPENWSRSAGARCTTWKRVGDLFREIVSQPLKNDRELLEDKAKTFRSWLTDLKELERALALDQEKLLYLAPMFPRCRKDFPVIFKRLDQCQKQLDLPELIQVVRRQFDACNKILTEPAPKKPKDTDLSRFYFYHDREIYGAGLQLLSELSGGNLSEKELYESCYLNFELDLNEWIQNLIARLSLKELQILSEELGKISMEARGKLICQTLKQELKLPKDLESFKKTIILQPGEIS